MTATVFLTVLSGVLTYVVGQLVLKLLIDPAQELRKTIGLISHSLVDYANVIQNPGVPERERIAEASQSLRRLSSQLHTHLYLVPYYQCTARLFRLPSRDKLLSASSALIGLSNSVFEAHQGIYETNAKRVAAVCDSLGIYLPEEQRWPKHNQ